MTFFALYKNGDDMEIKQIKATADLIKRMEGLFLQQESYYYGDEVEEIDFNGDYKLDDHAIGVIDVPEDAQIILKAVEANAASFGSLNLANFLDHKIKAIFTAIGTGADRRVLVQKFSQGQVLSRPNVLTAIMTDNAFGRLDKPAFCLDSSLVCIIKNGKLKFKSFHNVKSVFDLSAFYREATDSDIELAFSSQCLMVEDISSFKECADTYTRRMLHSIIEKKILTLFNPTVILEKAIAYDPKFNLEIVDGKIRIPDDKAQMKRLLKFLDGKLFRGILDDLMYQTNSVKKDAA